MKKEKEAVKEKIIKEYETFLKDNTLKKFSAVIQDSSFSSPRSLAEEYLKKHIKQSKYLGLPREIIYDINDKFDKSAIKNIYNRLSKNTKDELTKNYNDSIIRYILEALRNFESAILIAYKLPKLVDVLKKDSLRKRKELIKAKKHIDLLLKITFIADIERIKEILLRLREQIEKTLEKFKPVKINERGLAKLYDILLDPMKILYYFRYDIETYLKEIPFLIPEQQKGRPSKIFLKALQIIIYKLLILEQPKTKRQYKQWAKELTATIIEDYFARWKCPSFYTEAHPDSGVGRLYKTFGPWNLPKLKAKDIDQALHAS